MLPLEMKQQADTIVAWLARNGWEVVLRESPFEDEWWAYEIWVAESVWSPQGLRVYLTFTQIDPDNDLRYLIATKERPKYDCKFAEPQMSLLRGWEKALPAFMEELARSREAG
jgi:hypothetical protein